MTLVLAEDRIIDIQFAHRLEKPRCCRSSIKKRQLTVPKAFAISIFRREQGTLLWFSNLAVSCTALKFSWMILDYMNAL
jgi:hypothetical protein